MTTPLEVTYPAHDTNGKPLPDVLRKGTCVKLHGNCAEVKTRSGAALMDASTLTPDPRQVWLTQQATRKVEQPKE
jgi:hypothetical protein